MNSEEVQIQIQNIFNAESRAALATLIRLIGDFHLAEDCLQDAFSAALKQWPTDGVPSNPRSWLISVARFKAIDTIRRDQKVVIGLNQQVDLPSPDTSWDSVGEEFVPDDLLRLVFLCCHPVLSIEAQVALTLREVCGLSTADIAHAFLISETTLAQRIVRAKQKLREAGAPFEVPGKDELPQRLSSVLRVIYLVFNEGYYASSGESLTRQDLSMEALRLGELLTELLPVSEVFGLAALLNLTESRRLARECDGEIVLFEDQDRRLWNPNLIKRGLELAHRSRSSGEPGSYSVQAAISAEHMSHATATDTNWTAIVQLYDVLLDIEPSPIIELNRAVAVAMADGPEHGLALIEGLITRKELCNYGMAHSAKADLMRRLGRNLEAVEAYRQAIERATNDPERRFLRRRIEELTKS